MYCLNFGQEGPSRLAPLSFSGSHAHLWKRLTAWERPSHPDRPTDRQTDRPGRLSPGRPFLPGAWLSLPEGWYFKAMEPGPPSLVRHIHASFSVFLIKYRVFPSPQGPVTVIVRWPSHFVVFSRPAHFRSHMRASFPLSDGRLALRCGPSASACRCSRASGVRLRCHLSLRACALSLGRARRCSRHTRYISEQNGQKSGPWRTSQMYTRHHERPPRLEVSKCAWGSALPLGLGLLLRLSVTPGAGAAPSDGGVSFGGRCGHGRLGTAGPTP